MLANVYHTHTHPSQSFSNSELLTVTSVNAGFPSTAHLLPPWILKTYSSGAPNTTYLIGLTG